MCNKRNSKCIDLLIIKWSLIILIENFLEKFDEIIIMKNGKIVDSGKYDELINNNSIFKSLVEFSK